MHYLDLKKTNSRSIPLAYDINDPDVILWLNDEKPEKKSHSGFSIDDLKDLHGVNSKKKNELLRIMNDAIKKDVECIAGETEKVNELYKKVKNYKEQKNKIDIGGTFQPIPFMNNERITMKISAQSGSGKSTFIANLVKSWHQRFKNGRVFLISSKLDTTDKSEPLNNIFVKKNGKKVNLIQRVIVEDLADGLPDMSELKDCLVIFDDYSGFSTITRQEQQPNGKMKNVKIKLNDLVKDLINKILCEGRASNTSIILANHALNDGRNSKYELSECQYYVLFGSGSTYHSLKYLLKNYIGMGENEIKHIKKTESRWTMLHRNTPMYCIEEHSAYMVGDE